MQFGEYIKELRENRGWSRNELANKSNISHTEIQRIETGARKHPSLKNINLLAEALNVPQEDLLKVGGYLPSNEVSIIEKTFPGLRTEKQRQTIEKIAYGLSRNDNLNDEDLDDLYKQVEMFLNYAKNKGNSN